MKQEELIRHLKYLLYLQKLTSDLSVFLDTESIGYIEDLKNKYMEIHQIPQDIIDLV